MDGLKVLKNDKWCCQVAFYFFPQVCELGQLHRPWLKSNDFVENFRNCEVWKKLYFDWCQNIIFWWVSRLFFIKLLLLKGIRKDTLDICGLFWDVKTENKVIGQLQKYTRHETGMLFEHTTAKTLKQAYPCTIKRLNCILVYIIVVFLKYRSRN